LDTAGAVWPHLRNQPGDRARLIVNQHDVCGAVWKDLESNTISHGCPNPDRRVESDHHATVPKGREPAPLIPFVVVEEEAGRTGYALDVGRVLTDHSPRVSRVIKHNETVCAHLVRNLTFTTAESCGENDQANEYEKGHHDAGAPKGDFEIRNALLKGAG